MSEDETPVAAPEAPAAATPDSQPDTQVVEKVTERVIEKVREPESPREKIEREREELRDEQSKVFDKLQEDDDKELDERPRTPDGKFVAKDGTQTPSAKNKKADKPEEAPEKDLKTTPEAKAISPEAPSAEEAEEAAEAPAEPPKPKHTVKPPQHWDEAVQAKFESLEEDMAKAISDAGLKDRQIISRLGQQLKEVEPVLNLLKGHEQTFQQAGLDSVQGIQELLNAHNALQTNPQAALRQLAQRFNVDLWNLADGSSAESTLTTDPAIQQLTTQVQDLSRELQAAQKSQQAQQQAQQETAAEQIERVITDFSKDKPDFSKLERLIEANIHAIREDEPSLDTSAVLAKAYENARWSHPDTRAALEKDRLSQMETERIDKAKKEAEAAKKAAAHNVKSSPVKVDDPDDLRAIQREVWRKLNAA